MLSQVTSAFVGNIVGSDGKVYPPNTDFTSPTFVGVKKAAMIGYVSSTGHGLAIQLYSSPTVDNWYNYVILYDYLNDPGISCVTGYSWRIPSLEEWQNMVTGCGGAQGFITKYDATGVTLPLSNTSSDQRGPTRFWASDRHVETFTFGGTTVIMRQDYCAHGYTQLSVTGIQSTPQYSFSQDFEKVPLEMENAPDYPYKYPALGCFSF